MRLAMAFSYLFQHQPKMFLFSWEFVRLYQVDEIWGLFISPLWQKIKGFGLFIESLFCALPNLNLQSK